MQEAIGSLEAAFPAEVRDVRPTGARARRLRNNVFALERGWRRSYIFRAASKRSATLVLEPVSVGRASLAKGAGRV